MIELLLLGNVCFVVGLDTSGNEIMGNNGWVSTLQGFRKVSMALHRENDGNTINCFIPGFSIVRFLQVYFEVKQNFTLLDPQIFHCQSASLQANCRQLVFYGEGRPSYGSIEGFLR